MFVHDTNVTWSGDFSCSVSNTLDVGFGSFDREW